MNRKKIVILIISLVAIAALTYYAIGLKDKSGKSMSELIEFNIDDTASVDKIIITDPFSNKIELIRQGKSWTEAEGNCIMQTNVQFILEAFKNIEFKGYLPDNSRKQFIKIMSGQHTKVEIFQDGDWVKTWYIGPPAQDHYGQIMLLEDADIGKSDIPVMMKIKGMTGIIEPRFFSDRRKWMCTNIFALSIDKIAKVDVKYYDNPSQSFTVTKNKNNLAVYQNGKRVSNAETSMIFRYLQTYQKVHFDIPNYELNEKQVDSVKRSKPFVVLTVKETSGKTTKLRMFRIHSEYDQYNEFGNVVNFDMNKFWCELPNGQLVKCQYFVFNHLLMGQIYFPLKIDTLQRNKE